jgi:hypothetical protein
MESWKISFEFFACQSLKERNEDCKNDNYNLALVVFDDILYEKKIKMYHFFMQSCKPDYGSVIIASEVILDPLINIATEMSERQTEGEAPTSSDASDKVADITSPKQKANPVKKNKRTTSWQHMQSSGNWQSDGWGEAASY